MADVWLPHSQIVYADNSIFLSNRYFGVLVSFLFYGLSLFTCNDLITSHCVSWWISTRIVASKRRLLVKSLNGGILSLEWVSSGSTFPRKHSAPSRLTVCHDSSSISSVLQCCGHGAAETGKREAQIQRSERKEVHYGYTHLLCLLPNPLSCNQWRRSSPYGCFVLLYHNLYQSI